MTPNEINIAIAETQGWKICEANWIGFTDRNPSPRTFPNYHGSLDAIVPVVRAMPYLRKKAILHKLFNLTGSDYVSLATPAQWCEAYLKAEGLWK